MTKTQTSQGPENRTSALEIAPQNGRFLALVAVAVMALLATLSLSAVGPSHSARPVADKTANGGALARWSGYAVYGSFKSVTGSWTVPAATCPVGSTSSSTAWIGLDGANSGHVEQTGTDSACTKGTPYYYAWVELYGTTYNGGRPLISCAVAAASPCIPNTPAAGDSLSASINIKGGTWTFSLTDTTARWTYTATVSHPVLASGHGVPTGGTAEWIVEDNGAALTNFGHLAMTDAMVKSANKVVPGSSYPAHRFTASSAHGTPLATAGAFHRNGSFTDTWAHSL